MTDSPSARRVAEVESVKNATCINGKINVTIDVGMNLVHNNQPFICYG